MAPKRGQSAQMMPMMGMQFSGTGFVCCEGVSTMGTVFRLQDPPGSTLADLVATGPVADTLRSVANQMIRTAVTGTIISTPSALRPQVLVASATPMGAAPAPIAAAAPTPSPAPAPRPAPQSYGDCVLRCIASKVPGATVEELLNLPCNIALLAMEALPATTGPISVAALPASIVALASCVAATFGLTVGAVLECFIACAPGGRLTPEFMEGEEEEEDDNDNGSGGASRRARMAKMTRIATAICREAARRGVHLTQAQVAQMVLRHCRR